MRVGVPAMALAMTISACGTTVPGARASSTVSSNGELSAGGELGSSSTGTGTGPTGTGPTGIAPTGSSAEGGQSSASGQPGTAQANPVGSATGGALGATLTRPITTPIEVGILGPTSPAAAAAAIGGTAPSLSPQDELTYFVNYLNAQGGIDGRHISAVEDFFNPESVDYESEVQAACADFTQDHHVAVTISFLTNYYSESYETCLADAHVPDIELLSGGTDASDLAKYPMMISPIAPSVNQRYGALIRGLDRSGFLSRQTKIGVVVEDCPYNERAYTATLAPLFAQDGLSVDRRDVDCFTGFADTGAFIGQVGAEVLPFETAGVDRVMFVSGFEGVAAFAFQNQAATQDYTPSYALTSTASPGVNGMEFSAAAESRVEGVGWEPDFDVTATTESSAATRRCRAMWAGDGGVSRSADWSDDVICDSFFVLAAALAKSGGQSAPEALMSAFDGLGGSYQSPVSIEGATSYSADHREGPTLFATVGYKASCACFVYTSSPSPLGG